MALNFKLLYKEWLQKNGGLMGAVNESAKYYKGSDHALTTYGYKEKMLIAGSFFTFEYYDIEKLTKFKAGKSSMPYYDLKPLILSLGVDEDGMEVGFDLNVILPPKRIMLFATIFKVFDKTYMYNLEMDKKFKKWRRIPITKEFIVKAINLKNNIAINKYDRRKMRKIKLIGWDSLIILSTLYLKYILPNKTKKLTYQNLLNMSL